MLKDTFDFGPHACLVFDLLGKSLATFMHDNHCRPFPPAQLQHIARQLFAGVTCELSFLVVRFSVQPDVLFAANLRLG